MSDKLPAGSKVLDGSATRTSGVFEHVRERLLNGEWKPGQRLPGEHQLAAEYGVSRATVRTALGQLESLGVTTTRRGSGTYATASATGIRADIRRLQSLSATIAAWGHEPGMVYESRIVRSASPDECEQLDISEGTMVFAAERTVTADGEAVAISYDVIPRNRLPVTFEPSEVDGSLFDLLAEHGLNPTSSTTELHASLGPDAERRRQPDLVYVLLDQLHYTADAEPVMTSKTYFQEGRLQFSLVRVVS